MGKCKVHCHHTRNPYAAPRNTGPFPGLHFVPPGLRLLRMSLPFCVSYTLQAARLYELTDGRFQIVERGPLAPFMSGYGYLLVCHELAECMKRLEVKRVKYETAIIFDPRSSEEHRTHTRIHVGQYFKYDQISDLALDGNRLLTMDDQFLFVSPELKTQLEAGPFPYLRFTEGLSEFAAGAT